MTILTIEIFNLLSNSILSFIIGCLLCGAFLWLFKPKNNRTKLFILCLPFLKIIWDVCAGIPESSVIYSSIDPLTPPENFHRTLSLAFANRGLLPVIYLGFSGHDMLNIGNHFTFSFGDALYFKLHSMAPALPAVAVILLLAIGLSKIILRVGSYFYFRKNIRNQLAVRGQLLEEVKVKKINVKIYRVQTKLASSPFTGGILNPFICIPDSLFYKLTPNEVDAIIHHEIAHIKFFDLHTSLIIAFLGDLFWFVPGYCILGKKIDSLKEVIADRFSLSSTNEETLISALVKTNQAYRDKHSVNLYSAFLKKKSLLKERINCILSGEPSSRFGWSLKPIRFVSTAALTGLVIASTLGGNRPLTKHADQHVRLKTEKGG